MDRVEPTDGVELNVKRRKAAICRKRSLPAEAVSNSWGFENNDRSQLATLHNHKTSKWSRVYLLSTVASLELADLCSADPMAR